MVDRVAQRRARTLGIVTAVIGLAAIAFFSRAVGDATFILNPRGEDSLPDLVVPAGPTALGLGLLAVVLGILGATVLPPRRAALVLAGGLVLFVAAMLVWATAGGTTTIVGLLAGSVRRASPLALGALAGVLCERSGVVNIAIEGQLLAGAFAGAVVASATDNLYAGVGAGLVVGAVLGLVLAALSIRYVVDQIVGATVINIFALGMTSYLAAQVFGDHPDLNSPGTFRPVEIPFLGDIPVVGPVLFDNTFHVYAMFVLVAVVTFVLFRTRWGLRVRAVGEHPSAADTVGINVFRLRYVAVVLGGAVAGFGGTFFSLDSTGGFQENMTAGRGFIALAALIFGRWHPVGALGAALVFGFAEEFQSRLAALGSPIPSEFLLMAPYVVTLVVVAGLVGRARPPAADGVPYAMTDIDWAALRAAAAEVAALAYVPYSNFRVGAAAVVDDGRIVVGCNVENASYGLTLCAECSLVSALATSGGGRLVAVAVTGPDGGDIVCCGRCRQLLREHGGMDVLVNERPLSYWLPDAFGPEFLA